MEGGGFKKSWMPTKTGSTDGTYNAVNWKTGSTVGTKNAVNLKKAWEPVPDQSENI